MWGNSGYTLAEPGVDVQDVRAACTPPEIERVQSCASNWVSLVHAPAHLSVAALPPWLFRFSFASSPSSQEAILFYLFF